VGAEARRTVARAVAEALSEAGVDHVFGLLGSGNFEVTNGLVACGARFVSARHEGGAIAMADAYTRVSNRLAVCSVHQGPGLTNTLTGLTEAAKSHTPLLILAADSPAALIRSNFRIDQEGLVTAVGALSERLHSSASAVADAMRAHRRALVEQRPVVLSMPIDVQAAPAPDATLPPAQPALGAPRPPAEAVSAAASLLAAAKRPLIIAGRGAARSGARAAIEELGERLGALLATSAVANGMFSGNPWSLGISGGFASPGAAELIREADAVAAFGATLNMWTTRHGRLIHPDAVLVQVDLDPDAIGAHRPVRVGMVGDAAEAARALSAEIPSRPGWRSAVVRRRIEAGSWQRTPFEDASGEGRIDPRSLTLELDRLLPMERIISVDSGHFMGWPSMLMRVPDEHGFVFPQAFQAVGLGLACSIGAAIARPDRLSVAALGDGGLLMGVSELETAVRLGLQLLVVVYNDAAYGAEVHHFAPDGHPLDLVRFPETDIAAMARGVGARAATIRSVQDFQALTAWLEEGAPGVFLVDAKVDPTVVGEWLPEAFGH
jgi:thiamine pyrophosphate-dependent acetolactate synthase large subunit-like protein